jgi:predicted nucleic acid-binding protein
MILIDTSVLRDVLRDGSGENADRLLMLVGPEPMAFTRFTELEVLMGARDKRDWDRISAVLAKRVLVDPSESTWSTAARTHFDLRRNGYIVRSIVDCCIAQVAIENNATLIHNDRDFERIAEITKLDQTRLKLRPYSPPSKA